MLNLEILKYQKLKVKDHDVYIIYRYSFKIITEVTSQSIGVCVKI